MTEKEMFKKIFERIGAIVDNSDESVLMISDKYGGGDISIFFNDEEKVINIMT